MDPVLQFTLEAAVLAVMVVGLFGLIVPIFPGLVVIWVAALGYGLATGFHLWSGVIFGVITVLMIAGSLVDNVLMGTKAYSGGTNWLGVLLSMVAGVAGSFLLPPFGGIPASFLAIFLFEFLRRNDWRQALQTTKSMAVGCGWAFVLRFFMGVIMIGLWAIWAIEAL